MLYQHENALDRAPWVNSPLKYQCQQLLAGGTPIKGQESVVYGLLTTSQSQSQPGSWLALPRVTLINNSVSASAFYSLSLIDHDSLCTVYACVHISTESIYLTLCVDTLAVTGLWGEKNIWMGPVNISHPCLPSYETKTKKMWGLHGKTNAFITVH